MVVRTVRGDIDPAELGPTDAHEHLFFASALLAGEEFTELEPAIEEALTLAAAGCGALVDWTPLGLGRDPQGLLAVSEATGLHVIAATGVHREAHYPSGHPLRREPAAGLAARFRADLEGPGIRAGVIKVGAGYHRISPFEETAFEARLAAAGVAPSSVVLAHLDRNPDPGEHAETGAAGAWLELDGAGRTKYWPDSTILALIAELAARGLAGRILLGGDTGRRSMMRAYGGGPGLDYLFARFKPRLERELGAELARRIFVENPAAAFAFEPQ